MADTSKVKFLFFDVFGTTVDWRSSVIEQLEKFGIERHLRADWGAFANEWRNRFAPSMKQVTTGVRSWIPLEAISRESLDQILPEYGLEKLSDNDRRLLVSSWKRLHAWPDVVSPLMRLKENYTLCALSNGGVGGLVAVARFAGLPWDAVLGSNVFRTYKPDLELYRGAMQLLDCSPEQAMMVAAHNWDLRPARECGMRTAFVSRPTEYGPQQTSDKDAEENWDIIAADFEELAAKLKAN